MTSSTAYSDSSGRHLTDYPRPSLAVDTAVLTVEAGALSVVLIASGTGRRLPGTFLHEGEVLADAVRRSLREKAGIVGLRPEQLRVFDSPGRDDRGWVLSVAHVDVVPVARLTDRDQYSVVPVAEATGLLFDHDEIVALAADWLRARYAEHPDPAGLIDGEFTLRDLQRLHGGGAAADEGRVPARDGVAARRCRAAGARHGREAGAAVAAGVAQTP